MNKFVLLALLLLPTTLFADTTKIRFSQGWIKQLPPVIPLRAGYIEIENRSKQAHRIIAFQSTWFDSVEMHESLLQDGIMKMVPLDGIDIAAEGKASLKPGGKHLMLNAPRQALQIGESVELTVTFEDGSSQTIELEVRQ